MFLREKLCAFSQIDFSSLFFNIPGEFSLFTSSKKEPLSTVIIPKFPSSQYILKKGRAMGSIDIRQHPINVRGENVMMLVFTTTRCLFNLHHERQKPVGGNCREANLVYFINLCLEKKVFPP